MAFSDSIWQFFQTLAEVQEHKIFYQDVPIDHGTHVPIPFS